MWFSAERKFIDYGSYSGHYTLICRKLLRVKPGGFKEVMQLFGIRKATLFVFDDKVQC
jgi:hypothetical protein